MFPITHIVTIYRYESSGGIDSHSTTPVYENESVTIVPAGPDIAAYFSQPSHVMFTIYMYDRCELLPGDKIVSGSSTWFVKGSSEVFDAYGVTATQAVLQKIYEQT